MEGLAVQFENFEIPSLLMLHSRDKLGMRLNTDAQNRQERETVLLTLTGKYLCVCMRTLEKVFLKMEVRQTPCSILGGFKPGYITWGDVKASKA
jgi:hypothetical protein